jgi:hypothetical protein
MAAIGTRDEGHAAFWDVAEQFLGSGRLIEGTMMGHQCLRVAATNTFVATIERPTGNLVVKLPKERVVQLIESGDGLPYAPANKVFKEWAAIPEFDEARWTALIEEAMAFADG